ncbi:MAG TPA: winged helix-turn-helix domain-containing protein [Candidatus Acidoferrales bacterium]|nr:winged helix-turn-helix domain-containing protein [Candidatus Acidoferrales bacterium]
MQRRGIIQFGSFQLDLETGELRKCCRVVKLSPKPAQALAMLAAAPGRLITREAIRQELWDSDIHVDFEHALNFCIREIRKALGDNANKAHYIETLTRRGYRFIAESQTLATESRQEPPRTVPGTSQQIEALHYYESGRKSFVRAEREALEKARHDFERALEILPDYALAHSGLGAAHALRSLNRRDPEDLERAELHLTRALELDPEIAEPYPWLCYVFMRKNRFAAAVQAGHRGVQLQPDLVTAHYFLGLVYFAGAETDAATYQPATRHLLDATRVGPHWQPSWFVLSYLALLNGDYRHAELYANTLLQMSGSPKGVPFIGAEIVLGTVKLRQGDPEGARRVLHAFLDRMADSDHMYRDAMTAAAACVLGEVELRHGEIAAAQAAWRRGWHALQENPRIMAYQRTAARAQAGLAAAYAASGDRTRARGLLDRASATANASESLEHAAAAASMPEVYWTIATAWCRLGDAQRTVEALKSALRTGWRDAAWLERDPEFEAIWNTGEFQGLGHYVHKWPSVRFEGAAASGSAPE